MDISQRETAEQCVIGCILNKPKEAMPLALMQLQEAYFGNIVYSSIFTACRLYYKDNKAIDPVTIAGYFGSQDSDIRSVLISCYNSTPSTANYAAYISLVAQYGKKAIAKEKAYQLIAEVDSLADISKCRIISGEMMQCLQDSHRQDAISIEGAVNDFWKTKDITPEYIPTGFPPIDKNVFIRKGNYIVLGARSSMGKTAFALQLAAEMAKKYKVVFFSLETGADTITERLISHICGEDMTDIKNRSVKNWNAKLGRLNELKKRNLTIVEAAGYSAEQIKAKTIQLGAQVIFIDYLGLIQGKGKSIYEKVTQISMDLHTMAQQLGVVTFALVQLNRQTESDKGRAPGMADLRDSGQIEQDADIIMLLYNHTSGGNYDASMRLLKICKNKEGQTGQVYLYFNGSRQTFTRYEYEGE